MLYAKCVFFVLLCSMSLSTNTYAQSPPIEAKPTAQTPKRISATTLRAYAARKAQAQAVSRIKVVQAMWLKAPESNTVASLRIHLQRMQFEMLTIDLELQRLRKAYALSRARSAVRATERVAQQAKVFERHLHALKDSDTLSLKVLETSTHDKSLRAILGRIQTLPALPTK